MTQSEENQIVYTIGHSNLQFDEFIGLLKRFDITVVMDVRSQPYSKYTPHFNYEHIKRLLAEADLEYVFLGEEMGGRPDSEEFYDKDGYVLYDKVAESTRFQRGLEQLEIEISKSRVAIMCSEEEPNHCHRRLLISRVLTGDGYNVFHIRGDGSVVSEAHLIEQENESNQLLLFGEGGEKEWKSTQSVSQKRKHPSFSDY